MHSGELSELSLSSILLSPPSSVCTAKGLETSFEEAVMVLHTRYQEIHAVCTDTICKDWWLIHVSDNASQFLHHFGWGEGVAWSHQVSDICRPSLILGLAHVLEA